MQVTVHFSMISFSFASIRKLYIEAEFNINVYYYKSVYDIVRLLVYSPSKMKQNKPSQTKKKHGLLLACVCITQYCSPWFHTSINSSNSSSISIRATLITTTKTRQNTLQQYMTNVSSILVKMLFVVILIQNNTSKRICALKMLTIFFFGYYRIAIVLSEINESKMWTMSTGHAPRFRYHKNCT